MAKQHQILTVPKIEGVELGGLQNRVLLALRALHTQSDVLTANEICDWLARYETNQICSSLECLAQKGLVNKSHKKGQGRNFVYSLTDKGTELVHPKSGLLNYRRLCGASHVD